ncbi:ABC-F family ATP-binding cassette domain-containing protein [Streptomyces varsoviensis]|uniref:ABC-F family ATP-binding cassette domain-containing protein n=1 Tax=Streptomyces varsoviensis TaxID=67373 RepID=UPI0033FA1EC7
MQNSYRSRTAPTVESAQTFQITLTDVVRAPAPGRPAVLDGVGVSVALGERIGVIGENGSGKSTLLRMIAGIDAPDAGQVLVQAPGGLGYLPQTPDVPLDGTVQSAVDHALADLRGLEARMRAVEDRLGRGPDDLDAVLQEYGALVEAFEARDGYAADARVEAALHGLGLGGIGRERVLGSLSGGELSRLGLACLLAASPQVLLLDEPTNHLDRAGLEWLEERLRQHRGSVLVVSHDRVFLERVATALWEVDAERRTVTRHGSGYAGFLREKAAARHRWEQEHQDWLAEVDRQRALARTAADVLASGPRRDAERSSQRHQRNVEKQISARVRNAKERLRRLTESPVPPPPAPMRFTARPAGGTATSGRDPLADLAHVRVGDRLDIESFEVRPGERILVSGPNGAGKSTLLRVLAGAEEPDHGHVTRARRTGWLPQESAGEITDPRATLLAAYAEPLPDAPGAPLPGTSLPGAPEEHREALLGLGLFRPHDLLTPVGALSVGQLRRLSLARLLRRPVDLLLLDEPTNHLSPALVEDLEEALTHYRGALITVSHDRMLTRRFEGRRVELAAGRLRPQR